MGNFHRVAGAEDLVNFRKAALASASLSALFLIVYGAINWLTAQRADVGILYFEWERLIPFVPIFILPYMSIDLLFAIAPFLCKSDEELDRFAWRVIFVVMMAGACFLLLPLRYTFVRPAVTGWQGAMFGFLGKMDQPFNLLPSQHITLRTILAATYAKHLKGKWKTASHIWFSLIGFSTLLVYQHHVLDVLCGFLLAWYALYLFPSKRTETPYVPNYRIGCYYLIGFALVATIILSTGPWGALLLWPASSLLIAAAGYFKFGPRIYRKHDGRIPWRARMALGPVLIGQRLSHWFYKQQCCAYDEVLPNVWIGRRLNNREAAEAVRAGVTAVLDLTSEFSEAKPFRNVNYLNIPLLDLTAPTRTQLREISAFIEEQSKSGIVYVHCKAGYSRSAAAVAAYLLDTGKAETVRDAVAQLHTARPSIVIRSEIFRALANYAKPAEPAPIPTRTSIQSSPHPDPNCAAALC